MANVEIKTELSSYLPFYPLYRQIQETQTVMSILQQDGDKWHLPNSPIQNMDVPEVNNALSKEDSGKRKAAVATIRKKSMHALNMNRVAKGKVPICHRSRGVGKVDVTQQLGATSVKDSMVQVGL